MDWTTSGEEKPIGDDRVVKLFGWVIIVLYVVISLWMIIGQGIRLGTKDKDERRARRGGALPW